MSIWLFRAGANGEYESKFLKDEKIYLTWGDLNIDLNEFQEKTELYKNLIDMYGLDKKTAIEWASQIYPIAHRMQEGDWVVLPSKINETIHIGEIKGKYIYNESLGNPYYHYREVKWFAQDIPTDRFDYDVLNLFVEYTSVFEIYRNNAEERIKEMAQNDWQVEGERPTFMIPIVPEPRVQNTISDYEKETVVLSEEDIKGWIDKNIEIIKKAIPKWVDENFREIELEHVDKEKFILKISDKKVKISLQNLFCVQQGKYPRWRRKQLLDTPDLIDTIIDRIEYCIKADALDLACDNKKLIKTYCTGFKLGDYVEYFIDYGNVTCDDDWSTNFYIGDIEVRVEKPSELFQLVFKQLEDDKYLCDWSDNYTISLNGVNRDNYKNVMHQAIFYLSYINPSEYADEYPRIRHFSGKYYNIGGYLEEEAREMKNKFAHEIEKGIFSNVKYSEAVGFYNLGVTLQAEEVGFLYFYKVLEYFFIINHKGEFESIINEYNDRNNIDNVISEFTTIYKANEEALLKYLIKSIETEIRAKVNEAFNQRLISEDTVEEFTNQLYLYRNKIVHGKGDYRYTLKVPDDIDTQTEMKWNKIIRAIAEVLIFKYCLGR